MIPVHARADQPSNAGSDDGKQICSNDVALIRAGASAAVLELKGADDCTPRAPGFTAAES